MVSREELRVHGLRAYETGRLRAAARIALVLVPLAALCLFESRGREACACCATLLLGLAIWLRWRDRRGFESVGTGLLAGSILLVTGLLLDGLDLQCGLADGSAICTAFAVFIGGGAGILIGSREVKWRGHLTSSVSAATIAILAASLGCLRLGVVGLTSIVAGLGIGTMIMAARTRRLHDR